MLTTLDKSLSECRYEPAAIIMTIIKVTTEIESNFTHVSHVFAAKHVENMKQSIKIRFGWISDPPVGDPVTPTRVHRDSVCTVYDLFVSYKSRSLTNDVLGTCIVYS